MSTKEALCYCPTSLPLLAPMEQVEYMVVEDQHLRLFINDDHVKSKMRTYLSKMFTLFEVQASSLLRQSNDSLEAAAKMALMIHWKQLQRRP
ncbi:hypothetical protein EJ110_NYTH50698 [Nymphaea thermarum]|nr:hypothetical protein EJ110_NYTH50698 [Nymphaea thermarum]